MQTGVQEGNCWYRDCRKHAGEARGQKANLGSWGSVTEKWHLTWIFHEQSDLVGGTGKGCWKQKGAELGKSWCVWPQAFAAMAGTRSVWAGSWGGLWGWDRLQRACRANLRHLDLYPTGKGRKQNFRQVSDIIYFVYMRRKLIQFVKFEMPNNKNTWSWIDGYGRWENRRHWNYKLESLA